MIRMNQTMLDYVLERLDENRGRIKAICDDAGVKYRTIQKIYSGVTPNPRTRTIEPLYQYFQRKEAA